MKNKALTLSLILSTFFLASCGRDVKRMESADVHYQASKTLYAKGEVIQSLAEGMKAEQADPKNEEVQNFLGLLYAERGDLEKSKGHFQRAIKLKPDYSEAHNNLCAFLLQEGQLDEALKHCMKAVENVTYLTPERAYNNMGMIYVKKNDPVKASQMHSKALIHNKKFVFSLLHLGKEAYEKKDYVKAQEHLGAADEACVVAPKGAWGASCPESQYLLALTYLQLRDSMQAVMAFHRCSESDTSNASEYKIKCQKSFAMYDSPAIQQAISNLDQRCKVEYANNQKNDKNLISKECTKFINR